MRNNLLSNLQLTLDSSGKVLTVINVSTGKVLMINDGANTYSLIPGGRLTFGPDREHVREEEDDYEYGDCYD